MNPADYPTHLRLAKHVFRQSRAIHPDWDANDHRAYLMIEVPELHGRREFVASLPIAAWLRADVTVTVDDHGEKSAMTIPGEKP